MREGEYQNDRSFCRMFFHFTGDERYRGVADLADYRRDGDMKYLNRTGFEP